MRYSLISRDAIADCIEIMHEGYFADAIITLGGCDKTVPGALMPIARLNLVGITLFGGPALPGSCEDITLTDRGLDPGQVHHTTASINSKKAFWSTLLFAGHGGDRSLSRRRH